MNTHSRIVVLDDDPTGMQTFHGCLALTQRSRATLRQASEDACPFFFVLTDARVYSQAKMQKTIAEAVRHTLEMNRKFDDNLMFISGSDATFIEEKTRGQAAARQVYSISLEQTTRISYKQEFWDILQGLYPILAYVKSL